MMRQLQIISLLLVASAPALASQDSLTLRPPTLVSRARIPWLSRSDVKPIGLGLAALAVLSLADESVATRATKPVLQQNRALNDVADVIQLAGDPGAVVVSASLYVVGRVSGHPALSDASRHAIESLALSAIVTHSLKFGAGRARPNLTSGQDAFAFHPFRGDHDFNSFPSGHTTAAFAAASVFSAEISRSHRTAGRVVTPVLYGVAALVGGARIYNNRHWLSDVAAGALIGEVTARRVVRRAHTQPN